MIASCGRLRLCDFRVYAFHTTAATADNGRQLALSLIVRHAGACGEHNRSRRSTSRAVHVHIYQVHVSYLLYGIHGWSPM